MQVNAWFKDLGENLGPEESVASHLVRKAGTAANLREVFGSLSDEEVRTLVYDVNFWARRQQLTPNTLWEVCLMLAGRGFGKTFAGSVFSQQKAREAKAIGALVGPTAADARDTMIRGSSGILALSPPWFTPDYTPSTRRVTWPNGVYAIAYSADKPDRLRGPNCGWAWGDEPASWKHNMAALDQLPLILRIGTKERPPQLLLTGTPRPLKKLKELMEKPGTIVITGSSLANRANLAPTAVANMRALAKTRWGQQEVEGKLLLDVPGAIFGSAKWVDIDADPLEYRRKLERCVVSVDPAPTSESGSDETGMVVEGVRHINGLKTVSVLLDASGRLTPREWANRAIDLALQYQADIVVEVNAGGDLVVMTVETCMRERGVTVTVKPVRAREAKSKRAEPVSALAEAGRIELVGALPKLRAQLEVFAGLPGRRDDRVDALLWGAHELALMQDFWVV